jgi:hypothetical protein
MLLDLNSRNLSIFLLLLPHSAHSELPGFLMSSPMILTFRSTMMPAAVQYLCAGETGADSEQSVIMQETHCLAKPNKQDDGQIAKSRKEAVILL